MAREKSWMVKNNNNRNAKTQQLKLELANLFMVGEWKAIKMQLGSQVVILLKQEDFCGAIALFYFIENSLDLP